MARPPRKTPWLTCLYKVGYGNAELAQQTADRYPNREVYYCRFGGHYHVATKKRSPETLPNQDADGGDNLPMSNLTNKEN